MQTFRHLISPTAIRFSSDRALLITPSVAAMVQRWAVTSQQTARRNAMVAATACADRRAVRLDVEDFLLSAAVPHTTPDAAHG